MMLSVTHQPFADNNVEAECEDLKEGKRLKSKFEALLLMREVSMKRPANQEEVDRINEQLDTNWSPKIHEVIHRREQRVQRHNELKELMKKMGGRS